MAEAQRAGVPLGVTTPEDRIHVEKCVLFIYLFIFKNLFIYLFMAVLGLRFCARAFSLVVASGGHSSSRCAGLSLSWPLPLRSTGSRRTGSVVVAHGLSCSAACGIFPDQGSNPCPPPWQADSQPLRHQGSPCVLFLNEIFVSRLLQCGVARVWHRLLGLWLLPGVGTTWFMVSTPCSYTAFSPEFRVQPNPQQNFQRKHEGKDPNLLGK